MILLSDHSPPEVQGVDGRLQGLAQLTQAHISIYDKVSKL